MPCAPFVVSVLAHTTTTFECQPFVMNTWSRVVRHVHVVWRVRGIRCMLYHRCVCWDAVCQPSRTLRARNRIGHACTEVHTVMHRTVS
jgi:hypothetical protein